MGREEAETFRLSSFAAALRLNDLQRFKLERSQPHNLVTCQPRHDEVVVAVGANLCDRSTQFETSFQKKDERGTNRTFCPLGQLRFLYLLLLLFPLYRGVYGRYASNAGTPSLCATVRDHLRSRAPESPGFFPAPAFPSPRGFCIAIYPVPYWPSIKR